MGAAVLLAAGLTQVFTVCVNVYVPPVVTVMEDVVAPVLHVNAPEKFPAVKTVLPQ